MKHIYRIYDGFHKSFVDQNVQLDSITVFKENSFKIMRFTMKIHRAQVDDFRTLDS